MKSFSAVIFDLGGVVFGSPLHAIAAYEQELGIPAGFVNRVVVDTAPDGAWSRLERGELGMQAFFVAFEEDCTAAGQSLSAREMMSRMDAATVPRPQMLEAIRTLRAEGFKVAALTNNWLREDADDSAATLREHFDVFVESAVLGMRKPDPRIYRHTCGELGIEPADAVFLDDIGSNLKSARALGMHTIKVDEPIEALRELSRALGGLRLHS